MYSMIANSSDLARGIDLFNRAHFYDAHEVLEEVWRPLPRGRPVRRHLQGLVQLAVAFHHESRDNFIGARSVLDRACRNLTGAEDSFPQFDFARLRAELADWQQHLDGTCSPGTCSRGKSSRPTLPCIALRERASGRSPAKISKK